MNYIAFKETLQKKINEFPILFAFNEEQLEKGKQKLGVKENNELISIGNGGFIRKVDKTAFINLSKDSTKELEEFLSEEDHLFDAFKYELSNHEYCISNDHDSALEALGLSFEELTEEQKKILKRAKRKYLSNVIR